MYIFIYIYIYIIAIIPKRYTGTEIFHSSNQTELTPDTKLTPFFHARGINKNIKRPNPTRKTKKRRFLNSNLYFSIIL